MVSKPTDEGQTSASSDDLAVRSSSVRVPRQRGPRCHFIPIRTTASSTDPSHIPTARRSATVRLLQRRTPASRCRRRRVIASVPATARPDRRRRRILGGAASSRLGSDRRPPASGTGTGFPVTADPVTVGYHHRRVSWRTETSRSCGFSSIGDVIDEDGAPGYADAVSAF